MALYGEVWPFLPAAIRRARRWGSDWFAVSTPYLQRVDGSIVAHVGTVRCEWAEAGRSPSVAALHGVCVHPDHRGNGLARQAIESALLALDRAGVETVILWSEKVALYERFGFRPAVENVFVASVPASVETPARPLHLEVAEDLRLLQACLQRRSPVSHGLAAADSGWHFLIDLAIWIEAASLKSADVLYWLPDHETVLVAELEQRTLRVHDVVAAQMPPAAALLGAVVGVTGKPVDRIEFRFSPDRFDVTTIAAPHPDGDLLMVRGKPLAGTQTPFALSPLTRT